MSLSPTPNECLKTRDPDQQAECATSSDPHLWRALAFNPNVVPALQVTLAAKPDPDTWHNLAGRLKLDPAVQMTFATIGDLETKMQLALNRSLVPVVQVTLADTSDRWILRHLAENPATVPTIQTMLAATNDHGTWYYLAGNPTIVPAVQSTLAAKPDSNIWNRLAENRSVRDPLAIAILIRAGEHSVAQGCATDNTFFPRLQAQYQTDPTIATIALTIALKRCPDQVIEPGHLWWTTLPEGPQKTTLEPLHALLIKRGSVPTLSGDVLL